MSIGRPGQGTEQRLIVHLLTKASKEGPESCSEEEGGGEAGGGE